MDARSLVVEILLRAIALEEHFATSAFMEGPGRELKERAERTGGTLASLVSQLVDVGDGRVAAMDAAGVDLQALSLTAPGVEQLDAEEANILALETNAALAKAIERHPARFFGLAALPVADPRAAVAEMERVACAFSWSEKDPGGVWLTRKETSCSVS